MWYIIGKIEVQGTIMGYVIANPDTKQLQAIPIHQMPSIISQIVNAEYSNNQVVMTDGSTNRLFCFDTNMQPIQNTGSNKVFIFTEVTDKKEKAYLVFTLSGFFTIPESQLKNYDNTAVLINGKFVHQDGKIIISALRGTFEKVKAKPRTSINPYAQKTTKVETKKKENTTPTESYSKIKFRERLQKAILEVSAVNSAIRALGCGYSGNKLSKVYHANDIWIRTIKEPQFIYCDNILIKIAENSKSITQFVKSANVYFIYLKTTGKQPDLPIKFPESFYSKFIRFKDLKLPPQIKDEMARSISGGLFDASAIDRIRYTDDGKISAAYTDITSSLQHLTTKLKMQNLTKKAIQEVCCSDFENKNYWPDCFSVKKIAYLHQYLYYLCHKQGYNNRIPDEYIFYLKFWYYYVGEYDKKKTKEIIQKLNIIVEIIKPNMSTSALSLAYMQRTGKSMFRT